MSSQARGEAALTAAQRRALIDADPDTGRVNAASTTGQALCRKGLAMEYGRTGARYLTEPGRSLRTRLLAGAEAPSPRPTELPERPPGFAAATGEETESTGHAAPGDSDNAGYRAQRAASVAVAWEGLLEVRRITQGGDTALPAAWERGRMVAAVALALEAAGFRPSARDETGQPIRDGYRVGSSAQPDAVAVAAMSAVSASGDRAALQGRWVDPSGSVTDRLERYRHALQDRGWQATRHTDARGRWFLLVSPRRRGT